MDTLTVQVWKQDWSPFKSPAAIGVALAIARRSRESGRCWAKQATIAADCGISKQTVARVVAELEECGWLQKVPRRRNDGSRTSDIMWLTLPEVVLKATTVERKAAKAEADDEDDDGAIVDEQDDSVMGGPPPGRELPPTTESSLKGVTEGLKGQSDVRASQISTAVEMIWRSASKTGRERSSKGDIAAGLEAALNRGHAMETILKGLGGYMRSRDATKDDGAFQRGAHVMLAKDRFLSFIDEPQAAPASADEAQARADVGTIEVPSAARQRVWMDLYAKGMPWDPERGPAPGRLGCRVDPQIQREFGTEPYETPAAGDEAAFD